MYACNQAGPHSYLAAKAEWRVMLQLGGTHAQENSVCAGLSCPSDLESRTAGSLLHLTRQKPITVGGHPWVQLQACLL